LRGLSHEAKFKPDAKPRSDCSVRTEWVVYLGRNMYVYAYIHTHTHTHIHTHIHKYIHTYIHTHTYIYDLDIYVCDL
jgi:hypothetical protein